MTDLLLGAYQKHAELAFAIAHSIVGQQEAAADIARAVFKQVLARPEALAEGAAEKNWPYISLLIKHASLSYLRGMKKLELAVDLEQPGVGVQLYNSGLNLAEIFFEQGGFTQATAALAGLPHVYKDALLLRFAYGLSDEEISACLGMAIENVRVRLFRALKRLQRELREQELQGEWGEPHGF